MNRKIKWGELEDGIGNEILARISNRIFLHSGSIQVRLFLCYLLQQITKYKVNDLKMEFA